MNIALIISALITGGAERQILLSAAELGRLGHKVDLIIYHPQNEFVDFIRENKVNLVRISAKGLLRVGRIRALAKHLQQGGFEVVHAFSGSASIYAALAGKLARVPVILGGYRVEHKEHGLLAFAHRMIDRFLTGWIVNSRGTADSMVATLGINPQKFFVVYNGIAPEAFQSELSRNEARHKLGLPESQQVVTKVARMHLQKNHRLFLKMASIVLLSRPDVRFLIAGDGPLRSELEDYAKSLGVCDRVLFLGIRSDIPDVLAATDVSVLTSDFEGFPNALIEAMCVGIPVVTTDYPGVEELIVDGKAGFITPRNDAAAMAAKVTELLDDAELRKRMGQNGMEIVRERFSPVVMAQNLVSIYERSMNNQK
jgi:glycosyltransferase involved in cell wall biosynthesis